MNEVAPAEKAAAAPDAARARTILEIDDLQTHFFTGAGVVRAAKALPVTAPGGRAGIERESPCGQIGLMVVVAAGAGVPYAEQNIRMRAVAASEFVASVRIVPRPPCWCARELSHPSSASQPIGTASIADSRNCHRTSLHVMVSPYSQR